MLNKAEPMIDDATERHGVSPERLRAALGHFGTGVGVVTARDPNGCLYGSTAKRRPRLSDGVRATGGS
jgi:flavin reductase (DIM6/NTAB) family NADH-FMN oxidoreductase RutF